MDPPNKFDCYYITVKLVSGAMSAINIKLFMKEKKEEDK